MLKQIIVEPQMVSAYMQNRQRIPLTVMSFDVGVHELVIPVAGVEPNQITQVIAVFSLKRVKSTVQVFGEVKEDKVHIKLPVQLNRYKGRFGIEVDLRIEGNQTLTLAQFEAESRRSDIDANNVELLPYYFKLFDELVTEVQTKRADALEEITDETNDAIFDIGEQIRLTELAKTEAIQNINDKVELVETTKKTALTGINEQVESVESAKGLAIDAINDEKTLAINAVAQAGILAVGDVEAAEGSAVGAINEKVTNVDNVKKDAVTAIGEDIDAVSNLKTSALQSIADDTQSASDSLTTINGYQQTASDAVTAIDGHLANTTAKNELVNQKYSEFNDNIIEAGQNIEDILNKANKDKLVGQLTIINRHFDCSKISIDPETNTLTINGHGLTNGTIVAISLRRKESNKVPVHGKPTGGRLYVINATENTLQLSEKNGGEPLNFTTSGSDKAGDWIVDVPTIGGSSRVTGLTKNKYKVRFRGHLVTYDNVAIGVTANRFGSQAFFYQYAGTAERPDYLAIDGILENDVGTLIFSGDWATRCALVNGTVDRTNRFGSGKYIATENTSYDNNNVINSINLTNNISIYGSYFGHGSKLEVFEID